MATGVKQSRFTSICDAFECDGVDDFVRPELQANLLATFVENLWLFRGNWKMKSWDVLYTFTRFWELNLPKISTYFRNIWSLFNPFRGKICLLDPAFDLFYIFWAALAPKIRKNIQQRRFQKHFLSNFWTSRFYIERWFYTWVTRDIRLSCSRLRGATKYFIFLPF